MKPTFWAMAALSAGACFADTVSGGTQHFGLTITNATNGVLTPASAATTLTFNQFNPALGTLTGIEYGLTNSTQTQSLFV